MLKVNSVSVRYDKAIAALENVDFFVEKGGVVALLGPNGAGKTTLMKAIAGMLPFEQGEVVEGTITFDDVRIERKHPAVITRAGIALVQDGRQCFRSLTIGENLRAASFVSPQSATTRLEMVFNYFPFLKNMRDRQAGHLSGGQLQMLVIGMAIMGNPKLLMLDEPSLGLSPVMVQAVFSVVEQMCKELGMTVIVAEQTVPRLLQIATDVYVLTRGQEIVVQVTKDEIGSKGAAVSTYLSLPGRFVVLMHSDDGGGGISRKIDNESARQAARDMLSRLSVPEGLAVIIRTAGMTASRQDLYRDFRQLCEIWQQINKGAQLGRAPTLLYKEPDIVIRTIRDYFSSEVQKIVIDDEEEYEDANRYFSDHMPDLVKVLERHRKKEPIFLHFGIESAISELYEREVTAFRRLHHH